jgi:Fe-S-cluster containining protein
MKTIKQELPEIYNNIFPSFFNNVLPAEELATCDNCAMVQSHESTNTNENYYAPNLKCCTFYPTIPNYLIGAILNSNDKMFEHGQNVIKKLIEKGSNVFPTGIHQPKDYKLLYDAASTRGFGKSKALLCPFYNKTLNNCSIWKYRNSTCSTFFCKYVNGKDGNDFYLSLKEYLQNTETAISNYILLKQGFTSTEIIELREHVKNNKITHFDLDGRKNIHQYTNHWKAFDGKEIEFYIESYKIASELNEKDFTEIGGIDLEIKLGKAEKAYKSMINPVLPEKLLVNPDLSVFKTPDNNYKINNAFEISEDLYNSILFFDGYTSNIDTLKEIEEKLGLELDEELLVSLFQNRILIDSKDYI